MQIVRSSGRCRKGNNLQNRNNLGTMRMLEQWNNLQCECWNNGTTYNVNVGTTYNVNVGTTYNANVGTMKQHKMRMLEQ